MRWPVKHRQHRARLVQQEREVRHQALHPIHLARFVQQEVTLRHREVHRVRRAQVEHLIRWLVKHRHYRARHVPLEHTAQLSVPQQMQPASPALLDYRRFPGKQPVGGHWQSLVRVAKVLPLHRCRHRGSCFLLAAGKQDLVTPVLLTCTTRPRTCGQRLLQA